MYIKMFIDFIKKNLQQMHTVQQDWFFSHNIVIRHAAKCFKKFKINLLWLTFWSACQQAQSNQVFCAQENCSFVLRKTAVLCSGKLQFCAQENCSFAIPSLQLSKAISIDAKYTYTTSAPAVTDPDFLCYSGYFLGQCVQRYVNSVWTAKLFSAGSCWNSYETLSREKYRLSSFFPSWGIDLLNSGQDLFSEL